MTKPLTIVADDYWDDGWHGPTVIELTDGAITATTSASSSPRAVSSQADLRMPGAVIPGIYDSHVHLGLTAVHELYANGVSRVRDLGWDPHVAAGWLESTRPHSRLHIEIAGGFLTCAGGYPSGREWAPATSVCIVENANHAADRVAAQLALGATVIKVTLNADAGPVLDAQTVRAIVDAAHEAGVGVIAHAQGAGEAEKAFVAGVDELAHVPWSELLSDALVEAMAGRMTWVSTFDIHGWGHYGDDFEKATANARRFVSRGGHLRYGTDLGNGSLPVGVNKRELLAMASVGLDAGQLARASFAPVTGRNPMGVPGPRPLEPVMFAGWLATARPLLAS